MRGGVLLGVMMVLVAAVTVVSADPEPGLLDRAREAYQGTRDMVRAYTDMRDANWKDSDRYFHARGNSDAAQRGPGGRWAATVISEGREFVDRIRGGSAADSARDQEANHWGRNGGDPNRYRPEGLPEKY